jgi:twitching motility two-component system response regulator PilH
MSRKVLIAGDSIADRWVLEQILIAAGHSVLLAESGEQAFARAKSDMPDVVMMDVNMPDMEGFAATRRLKTDAATKHIPVVFVTGMNKRADEAWGRMLGANGYVSKPYSPAQVLEQVAG